MKKKALLFFRIAGTLLLIALYVVLILLLLARITGRQTSVFGISLYSVMTGSMEPVLSAGDVIVSRNYNPGSELKVGDIVTYNGREGALSGKSITHEIISVTTLGDGSVSIVTQGRANNVPDPAITPDDVVSVYLCKSHLLTLFHKLLSTTVGFLAIYILPVLVFVISEIRELAKNRKKKKALSETGEVPTEAGAEGSAAREDSSELDALYREALEYLKNEKDNNHNQ